SAERPLCRTAAGTAAAEARGAPAAKSGPAAEGGPATEGGPAAVPGAAAGVATASAISLPRVLGDHEPAGRTTEGLLVGPGAGDNAAAALGLGAASGDVVISIGTSGTVFGTTEVPIADASGTVAGFASADGGRLPLV